MSGYLFLFTITPVQSFVAEARKAQDFFEGSNLLSELTNHALKEAEDTSVSCDIIFPKEEIKSKPNRFMAVVEISDIKKFGDELKAGVEKKFFDWVDKSWNFIEKKPENYEFQKKNYLSITWVAVEYDPEKDDYFAKYKEIESLLGGAKNVRDFAQLPDTEAGRKCSVCGARNAIIFSPNRKNQIPYALQKDAVIIDKKNDKKYYLMNENEGLCAICAAKRFDKEAENYESTSDIALLRTLEQFKAKGGTVEKSKYDPQYLIMLKDQESALSFEHLEDDVKKYTEELSGKIKSAKIRRTPYYALVAFDGDSMGKTLGGGKLKTGKNLREFQEKLTQALGNFACDVKDEQKGILKNEGRVVYAGGEDFFGFINHFKYIIIFFKTM